MCPFYYTANAGSWNVGSVDRVNHNCLVAVVTETDIDLPKFVYHYFGSVLDLFFNLFMNYLVVYGFYVVKMTQMYSLLSSPCVLYLGINHLIFKGGGGRKT